MLTASLADAKQYTPIPAGMLSRHKAHPCRQVPAILEVCSIPNSGNDCRCSLWADTTYLGDTLANVALAEDGFDLLIEVSDLFVELQKEGTTRTARARTSGENSFVVLLVIDPTSHEFGSPANPGLVQPSGDEHPRWQRDHAAE